MKNDLRIRALSAQGTRSSPQGHVDTPDGGNLGSWGLRAVELNPPPNNGDLDPVWVDSPCVVCLTSPQLCECSMEPELEMNGCMRVIFIVWLVNRQAWHCALGQLWGLHLLVSNEIVSHQG